MFKKKEEYIEKKGILGNAEDYSIYNMSMFEKIGYVMIGSMIGGTLGYLFYENMILALIVAIIGAFSLTPIRRKQIINKRNKKLLLQFKDALESLSTSIGAGNNVQDSFAFAEADMITQYSKDSMIAKELNIINSGVHNNINVERMLMDFGDRSGLDDIKSFASVFETCYRKGGDTKEVIKNTHLIICEKIDITMEIQTLVSSKVSEQNMMLIMPVIFVLLFKMMGKEVINLSTPIGRVSTSISLCMFAVSYFIGRKILNIKV